MSLRLPTPMPDESGQGIVTPGCDARPGLQAGRDGPVQCTPCQSAAARFHLDRMAMPRHFAHVVLVWSLLIAGAAHADEVARVIHPDALPAVTVSEGVQLKELTGRVAPAGARSRQGSVALFQLAAGKASAWSHNKVGEESFFVLEGHGEVWVDGKAHPVGPGDYILVQPQSVRSIRASRGEALRFYAITTPAWSQDDDVLVPAPAGAPK